MTKTKDLVERLRAYKWRAITREAADEIEQLSASLSMLIVEAQNVADDHHHPRYARLDEALASARKTVGRAASEPCEQPQNRSVQRRIAAMKAEPVPEFGASRDASSKCEHEWEIIDEGGGGSEFQPPDPPTRQCILCGSRQ